VLKEVFQILGKEEISKNVIFPQWNLMIAIVDGITKAEEAR
jgi:hypothetical protein